MYLKSIDIQGFKSFADKIHLEFNNGITSVVGPNGSGKSNISDSIRWVLGEQSAKSLRGSKMEDIIFAGTEHRKPLGFAEVTLTLDNQDGALPVDFSEVTITRRVYRSGESEYLINKASCRLRDIHELFMDTGIGRDGYSIIGQGKIDEILSNNSDERRSVFEEASGIMKFKVRKNEAERKLELTSQNLLRINDIIGELENQLEPLREQSEVARKYLSLRDQLKGIEIGVYLENIERLREKNKEYEKQLEDAKYNIDKENKKIEHILKENEIKSGKVKEVEEEYEVLRQEYFQLENTIEKYHSDVRLGKERIDHSSGTNQRLEQEIAELEVKIKTLEQEKAGRKAKIDNLNRTLGQYNIKLAESEKHLEEVMSRIDSGERFIEELKGKIIEKMDVVSDKRVQAQGVKSFLDNIVKREHSLTGEKSALILEKDKEGMDAEDLAESIAKTNRDMEKGKQEMARLQQEKSSLEQQLNGLNSKCANIKNEMFAKRARQKLLDDMEKSMEGYNRSVKGVLQACAASPVLAEGIHGALGQLIEVEAKYETAIEMALGGALQNIITSTEESAKKAIEFLKANRLGRATFLPISAVKGRKLEENIAQVQTFPGFEGIASDLVECKPEHKNIILNLLGKVVVASNLDAGIAMARKFRYAFRIVTLEGEIINSSGAMTGGSSDNRAGSLLSRHREISELKENIVLLENDLKKYEKNAVDLEKQISETAVKLQETDKRVRELELIKIRDESHLNRIREDIGKIASRLEMISQEAVQLVKQKIDTGKELESMQQEQQSYEKDIENIRERIAEYQENHKNEQMYKDNIHREITDLKISLSSIQESINSYNENIERLDGEIEIQNKGIHKRNSEINRAENELNTLALNIEELEKKIQELEQETQIKKSAYENKAEERKALEDEIQAMNNAEKDANRSIMLLQEEYNRVEVRKTKFELELDAIQNRMWDEYEVTYTNAQEYKREIPNMAQAQKQINELKGEIRELGPVNVAAIDEYVKTRERYEFLLVQQNDLDKSKEKLQKVIQELLTSMRKQFMEQFALINENFGKVFIELFGGGRAELVLADRDNVLESDIDIVVQPPGKKLQNMMLLSGGEKAFTAIALLFAILRLKPSPFCVLDEIEAALDDANVYRFAEYLKQFAKKTQFVMITHRKGTMEAADTLYGVTMQEHGVSRLVSLKLGEKAS